MIDTDKYEGHTEGKWRWYEGARHKTLIGVMLFGEDGNNEHPKPADAQLIADAPLLLEEVKRLRDELNRAYDTIQEYEEVIEPKRLNKIERLEKALKSNSKYNAVVDATGNAGGGSIMVDVTFDDGGEYYGILDKVIE